MAFTPADLFSSGQKGCWYDPSDLSTLFQDDAGTIPVTASGQSVRLMLDKSGNGNHASLALGKYVTPFIGTTPIFRDDGTYRWLEFSNGVLGTDVIDFASSTALSIYFGIYKPQDSSSGLLYETGNESSNGFHFTAPEGGVSSYKSLVYGVDFFIYGFPAPVTNVISVLTDLTSTVLEGTHVRVNGALYGASSSAFSSGTVLNNSLNIGGRNEASAAPFNGNIYSLIIVAAEPTATEVYDTESWINDHCGAYTQVVDHISDGDVVGPGSNTTGSATHHKTVETHPSAGNVIGKESMVTGSAKSIRHMTTTGAVVGYDPTVTGTAKRYRAHTSSGALSGSLAIVTGDADNFTPAGIHDTYGDVDAGYGTVTGDSHSTGYRPTSGAVVGYNPTVVGAAHHYKKHTTSGNLIGAGTTITGTAARKDPTLNHGTFGTVTGYMSNVNGTAVSGNSTLTPIDIQNIVNAVWADPRALTVSKFLALQNP